MERVLQNMGSGMEDVIFSGTSNRPSKNISEVCLLLDNLNKEGPNQYKDFDEISVKRKIEKDKGSKYYINDKEVRARDVQTLLLISLQELIPSC